MSNYWQDELSNIFNVTHNLIINGRDGPIIEQDLITETLDKLSEMQTMVERIIIDLEPAADDDQYTSSVEMDLEDSYEDLKSSVISNIQEICQQANTVIQNNPHTLFASLEDLIRIEYCFS